MIPKDVIEYQTAKGAAIRKWIDVRVCFGGKIADGADWSSLLGLDVKGVVSVGLDAPGDGAHRAHFPLANPARASQIRRWLADLLQWTANYMAIPRRRLYFCDETGHELSAYAGYAVLIAQRGQSPLEAEAQIRGDEKLRGLLQDMKLRGAIESFADSWMRKSRGPVPSRENPLFDAPTGPVNEDPSGIEKLREELANLRRAVAGITTKADAP